MQPWKGGGGGGRRDLLTSKGFVMVDYCRNVVLQVFQRPSFSGQNRKSYICRAADGECDVINTSSCVFFCDSALPLL